VSKWLHAENGVVYSAIVSIHNHFVKKNYKKKKQYEFAEWLQYMKFEAVTTVTQAV
jgi:hypothetical protein